MIKLIALITIITTTLQNVQTDTCHRNLYLGSPVNTIHKAHEYIEHILQASNTNSSVNYIGGDQKFNQLTGETYHEYLFRLDPESERNSKPRALLMRVTVDAHNYQYVDDFMILDGPNGIGDVNDRLNWFLSNKFSLSKYQNNFFNPMKYKKCDLIKESFTYFYEMYGSRFSKDLN